MDFCERLGGPGTGDTRAGEGRMEGGEGGDDGGLGKARGDDIRGEHGLGL